MPDLQAHLRAVAEKQQQEKLEAAKAEDRETLEYAVNRLQVLGKLVQSPEVKDFLEMLVRPMVTEEHDAALDLSSDKEKRADHAQRHGIAREILEKLDSEHARWLVVVQEKTKNQGLQS